MAENKNPFEGGEPTATLNAEGGKPRLWNGLPTGGILS